MACAAGLAAGFVAAAIVGIRRWLFDILASHNFHAAWMMPLGTLIIFGVAAVLWVVFGALWPRLARPPVTAAVFGGCAAFAALLPLRELHPAALAVLAVGIGVACRRAANADPARWRRLARRSAAVLSGMTLATAVVVAAGMRLREARALAALPAAMPGAKSVLFIILDTVRASSLGLYGYTQRPTSPRIDAFARRGTTFDLAIAPSSWTLPSHASMFTARRPGELSARWHVPLDARFPTLAEALAARGWRTGAFSANDSYGTVDAGLGRGFSRFDDYQVSLMQILLSAPPAQMPIVQELLRARSLRRVITLLRRGRVRLPFEAVRHFKRAPRVTRGFLAWLDADTERPFFAFLNYFDAHNVGQTPPPFDTAFGTGRGASIAYDRSIAWLDHEVGALFDSLAARGRLDSLVVVITADHGEQLGEHGLRSHGNSLYMPALHVPLIVVAPGVVAAGSRVRWPVSLQVIAPTMFELAGALDGGLFPVASLSWAWSGRAPADTIVVAEVERSFGTDPREPAARGALRALIDPEWHYIRGADAREELFAYRTDSLELDNLAARSDPPPALGRLRALALRIQSGY